MKLSLKTFRRLQWKLTFSYTLITVMTLLVIELIVIVIASESTVANLPQLEISVLKQHVPELVPYLLSTPPNRAGVAHWLEQTGTITAQEELSSFPRVTFMLTMDGFTLVADRQGWVVASRDAGTLRVGMQLAQHLPSQAVAAFRAALDSYTDYRRLVVYLSDGSTVAAYPIQGPGNTLLGVLMAQTRGIDHTSLLLFALFSALLLSIPTAFLAAIIGTIFGFVIAHGFSRRFQKLSSAAQQWSQGNFTIPAADTSGDELGQLIRQLNLMAEQFQTLLQTRQKAAVMEERNRLARDLHDSMKQQVFAIALLVNTARGILRCNSDQAQACLDETDALVQQVQQEMTSLVRTLHPVPLDGKGLASMLQELALQWSHQTGIITNVQIASTPALPQLVEEAFFRITQEALTNVARHSQATTAEITLSCKQNCVMLTIQDNGVGFDVSARKGRGIGLISMQERMHTLGGVLLVEGTPGKGAKISANYVPAGIDP